jgi:hypothetical protein
VLLPLLLNNLLSGSGLVTVPDVVGDAQAAGTAELEAALFVVSVSEDYSDSVAVGNIISQQPTGGSQAAQGSTVTIVVSLGVRTNTGAGRSRKRRYEVEIDGQIFPVESVDHARALLEQARELALQKAPQVAQAVVEKRLHSKAPEGKPIRVPAPQLHTASDELAAIVIKARHDIARIYRQASLEAELRLRLREQENHDSDEDDIILLL